MTDKKFEIFIHRECLALLSHRLGLLVKSKNLRGYIILDYIEDYFITVGTIKEEEFINYPNIIIDEFLVSVCVTKAVRDRTKEAYIKSSSVGLFSFTDSCCEADEVVDLYYISYSLNNGIL